MKKNVLCIEDCWKDGLKDPDLTKGKLYEVLDKNVMTMGSESTYSIIGDNGEQVDRPKHIFQIVESNKIIRKRVPNYLLNIIKDIDDRIKYHSDRCRRFSKPSDNATDQAKLEAYRQSRDIIRIHTTL